MCSTVFIFSCQEENTVKVKQETIDITVSAIGELESKQRMFLAPPKIRRMWQYNIQTMLPENTSVKKGTVVLSFDDKKVRERLIDQQGQKDQAQKKLENKYIKEAATEQELVLAVAEKKMEFEKAQRKAEIIDHSRSENDRKKATIDFTIATNDLDLATKKLAFHRENTLLNIKRAQQKLARLSSKVKYLQHNIKRLKVVAPIDGLVIYKANWNGEKPSIGTNVQIGESVIELAVIEEMQIKAQITEPDSGQIKAGQQVKITLDSAKDRVFNGVITSLGQVFREKSWQDKRKIFDVIIDIDKVEPEIMRPGMTARIEVTSETIPNALTLPSDAIKHQGEEILVQVKTTFGSENRLINISHILKNKVVISHGLQAGDAILR